LVAFAKLRREFGELISLDVVTKNVVPAQAGVTIHTNMHSNDLGLVSLVQNADVGILPTRADMLPVVLTEMGACGCALIGTDVGAVGEVVLDNQTGLLIEYTDADLIESAMRVMIENPSLRQAMGRTALEMVRETYTLEQTGRALSQLIQLAAD